jgi:molecular chaperone GrpE
MSEEQDPRANGSVPDQAAAADGPAPTPEERLATVEAERNETRDRMLRIAAEFENYKKRAKRDQAEGENKVRESVLRDMLEVIERAVAASSAAGGDPRALQQGVELVLRLFQNKLERHEVRPFDAKGKPFDPRLHDAISQVASTELPPGSVVNEVQKGYKIGDRLLRPAMVAVASGPPSRTPPPVSKTPPPSTDGSGNP